MGLKLREAISVGGEAEVTKKPFKTLVRNML